MYQKHHPITKNNIYQAFIQKGMARRELSQLFGIPYFTVCWIIRKQEEVEYQKALAQRINLFENV